LIKIRQDLQYIEEGGLTPSVLFNEILPRTFVCTVGVLCSFQKIIIIYPCEEECRYVSDWYTIYTKLINCEELIKFKTLITTCTLLQQKDISAIKYMMLIVVIWSSTHARDSVMKDLTHGVMYVL